MANLFDKWVEEEEYRYEKFCEREDDFFRQNKELAFTLIRGIKNSKLAQHLKRNFILENRYRCSGVSIADELGRDEIRITLVVGEKYGDWIVISSLLNREKKRYWYNMNTNSLQLRA